ncbi:nucleic acid/nucleotide deaminase domain-containing protein [Streptosporangium sp. NPDC023963]|uniref:nucleic acid/nucleotide deaminase domain-containing protein n=1 Tax=Streptosporangium sp. NPDC023963 TaxID=3155608 RepID=UPI003412283F
MRLARTRFLAGIAFFAISVTGVTGPAAPVASKTRTADPCPPGYVPPRLAQPGAPAAHIPYRNPIAQVGFSYRDIMDRDPDLGRDVEPDLGDHRNGAFNPYLNVAVGFVDVTGCATDEFDRRFLRTVDELRRENPALLEALNLPPEVKALLVVPRFNANKTRKGKKGQVEWIATAIEHSERRILKSLAQRGVDEGRLLALYTDLAPCSPRSADCRTRLLRTNAAVYHSFVSPFGDLLPALREALANMTRADVLATDPDTLADEIAAGRRSVPSIFQPRDDAFGAPPAGDADDAGLARAAADPNGGIDFSSLELRYLADAGTDRPDGVRYGFTRKTAKEARKDDPDTDPATALRVTRQASDAFFVWLALRPSTFTVNLNPSEPDRIIDADLGRTDAGRILLEADFRMKKTVAGLIHPDSATGGRYWRAADGTCLVFRQWIVPGPATVHEHGDELYILDAPLRVKLENEYLAGRDPGLTLPKGCAGQSERQSRQSERVFREMILSRVEKAVNTAPEYAALRRVYLSRVAAEWYRKRSRTASTTFTPLIDSGDIGPWTSRRPWKPVDVFDAYARSYKNGEFKVTRDVGSLRYSYFYGGVDFTTVSYGTATEADLRRRWSTLPGARGARSTWLTGASRSAENPARETTPLRAMAVIAAWVGSFGLAVVVVLAYHRRRHRPRPPVPYGPPRGG